MGGGGAGQTAALAGAGRDRHARLRALRLGFQQREQFLLVLRVVARARFRQQINENSKMLCWHHVIPEMNHNEILGWAEKKDGLAVGKHELELKLMLRIPYMQMGPDHQYMPLDSGDTVTVTINE